MKARTLREMTRDELVQKKNDLLDELFNLRMRRSLKSLDNPLRLREVKRNIGRIETILHEDEMGLHKLAETKASILESSGGEKRDRE